MKLKQFAAVIIGAVLAVSCSSATKKEKSSSKSSGSATPRVSVRRERH